MTTDRGAGKGATHDEASSHLLTRPEHQLSRPGGRELVEVVDVFTQNQADVSCTQLGGHIIPEPV